MPTLHETLPPMPADDAAVAAVVAEVDEMNGDDWTAVVDNRLAGVPLTIEYRFSAPNEPAAADLGEFLTIAGYAVSVGEPESETDDWAVGGTTPEATTDERGLTEWVRRMAAAGVAHGDCVLDGWALVLVGPRGRSRRGANAT